MRYDLGVTRAGSLPALLPALILTAAVGLPAFERTLTPDTVAEAIGLGQSRIDDVRTRFHSPYRVAVGQPPVDFVEVVTPFRRVALDAEAHAAAGGRLYGQREALLLLGDDPTRIDFIVELTFHPMNTYLGIPDYAVTLAPAASATAVRQPKTIARIPRFGPRVAGSTPQYPVVPTPGVRNGSQPLLGSSIVATFDGQAIEERMAYILTIAENGKELARSRIDFSALR